MEDTAMPRFKNQPVTVLRAAQSGDNGFDASKDQVLIRDAAGVESVALRSEVSEVSADATDRQTFHSSHAVRNDGMPSYMQQIKQQVLDALLGTPLSLTARSRLEAVFSSQAHLNYGEQTDGHPGRVDDPLRNDAEFRKDLDRRNELAASDRQNRGLPRYAPGQAGADPRRPGDPVQTDARNPDPDRKSTRLNSSH